MVVKIGVLAIQGSFSEHLECFQRCQSNVKVYEIRSGSQLTDLDIQGLVIPGGESTTMGHFLLKNNFLQDIKSWFQNDKKFIWGTCAGLILLADEIGHEKQGGQCKIGGLAVEAQRNSYGRQKDSCQQEISVKFPEENRTLQFDGIFIRAPKIAKILDQDKVEVLATKVSNGEIVGVKQDRLMATTFHPELTNQLDFHQFFIDLCSK